jgi:hypothetical protein
LQFDGVKGADAGKLLAHVANIQKDCGGHQATTGLRQCARLE